MKKWNPRIKWIIGPLETHAIFFALASQIKRKVLDPTDHLVSMWFETLKNWSIYCAPVPPDFEFFKKICENELDYLADFVGDESYGCGINGCRVYDHRIGLRLFLEDKLGITDKFANTGIK